MTRTTLRSGSRAPRGFTLIELLVVLGIIAILLALTSAALQKTNERAQRDRSGERVNQYQKALDGEIARVNEMGRTGAMPQAILDYAEGDVPRARAIWTALLHRRHFPQTFSDATTAIPVYIVGNPQPIYTLQPLESFRIRLQGVPAPSKANEESGILLYMILADKTVAGGGAMATSADELSGKKVLTINGAEFPTFSDGFQRPIGFVLWDDRDEAQSTDYLDATAQARANKDPLDPRNLVAGWTPDPLDKKKVMAGLLGFKGRNRMASVYSVGKDEADPKDDILGFRTHRHGNKGY